MHFQTKIILKSNINHTLKHAPILINFNFMFLFGLFTYISEKYEIVLKYHL